MVFLTKYGEPEALMNPTRKKIIFTAVLCMFMSSWAFNVKNCSTTKMQKCSMQKSETDS